MHSIRAVSPFLPRVAGAVLGRALTRTRTQNVLAVRTLSIWSKVSSIFTMESHREVTDVLLYNAAEDTDAGNLTPISNAPQSHAGPVPGRVASWRLFNDSDYGGSSKCALQLLGEPSGQPAGPGALLGPKYLRMTGNIELSGVIKKKQKVVGGFCAYKGGIHNAPIDLRDYEGLELVVRTSRANQAFTLNLGTQAMVEGDIYQVRIDLAGPVPAPGSSSAPSDTSLKGPGPWKEVRIPFASFHVTAKGIHREQQRMNDSLQVEDLGFLFKEDEQLLLFHGQQQQAAGAADKLSDMLSAEQSGGASSGGGGAFHLDLRSIRALSACDKAESRIVR